MAQHEIGRSLTYFRTVQHQAHMFRSDVFTACFQAVSHRTLQAHLMTSITGIETGLYVRSSSKWHVKFLSSD